MLAFSPTLYPRVIADLVSERIPSVLVDDFYLVEHGEDDAPSIRLAVDYALSNAIERVEFSPKVYNIVSNVPTIGTSYNSLCGIQITSSEWFPRLILDGNQATLAKSGEDFADIIQIRAMIGSICVRNLKFIREHLETPNIPRAGIGITALSGAANVDRIEIDGCVFSDCLRAINIGEGLNPVEYYGKCHTVIVSNCSLLYPRGSNFDSSVVGGGSQAMIVSNWVRNLKLQNNFFDGASSGDLTGMGNEKPVDGIGMFQARDQSFINNRLTHFSVEGIYCMKQPTFAESGLSFVVPAVGESFAFPVFQAATLIGWKVGDRFRISSPGVDVVFTHEFEVVGLPGGATITATVISGAAVTIPDYQWITHEVWWTDPATVTLKGNRVYSTQVAPYLFNSGGSPGIACKNITTVIVQNNEIKDCYIGYYDMGSGSLHLADNNIKARWQGIILNENCGPTTIERCAVELYGAVPGVGINSIAASLLVSDCVINMEEPVAGYGTGIAIGGTSGNIVTGVTFENLDTEYIEYRGPTECEYTNNVGINITNPQTIYP